MGSILRNFGCSFGGMHRGTTGELLGCSWGDKEVTAEGQLWDCAASARGFRGQLGDQEYYWAVGTMCEV